MIDTIIRECIHNALYIEFFVIDFFVMGSVGVSSCADENMLINKIGIESCLVFS